MKKDGFDNVLFDTIEYLCYSIIKADRMGGYPVGQRGLIMLLQMYVIRDCLAEESSSPMLAKNDSVAIVMFKRSVDNLPFDGGTFKLLHIGMMDTDTTTITITPIREVDVPIAVRDPAVPGLVDDLMGMKKEVKE